MLSVERPTHQTKKASEPRYNFAVGPNPTPVAARCEAREHHVAHCRQEESERERAAKLLRVALNPRRG